MIETNTIPNVISGHNIQPVLPTVPCNVVYNEDCMEGLKRFPDNYFDLAMVDPPYGIDASKFGNGSRTRKYDRSNNNAWDSEPPTPEYWQQLFRVSKNQIIFGMNYYSLPPIKHFIVWDKKQPDGVTFAQAELIWTSFEGTSKIIKLTSNGQDERIHPTQKPIELYDKLIGKYANANDIILDTHLGSGSSRISCNKAGLSFVGFEINPDYYAAQEKRFKTFTSQLRMF
jgi:site-specific DNA-methyltransferase (adenine-specific)